MSDVAEADIELKHSASAAQATAPPTNPILAARYAAANNLFTK